MTIQPISAASVVLYLSPADLKERGLSSDKLTAERTLELAREAFCRAGLSPEGALEIETYPEQCGVLVFVHICPPRHTAWRFADCESLLAACAALPEGETDGDLYWWGGRFWLVLPNREDGAYIWLSEFADQENSDPYISARLEEYGARLLSGDAPAALRRHFGDF